MKLAPRTTAIAGSLLLLAFLTGCAAPPDGETYDHLRAGFRDPPAQARPGPFWTWLNGHADPARITAEMEAFAAAGFSRLQVWDVKALQDPEKVVPVGPPFLSDAWLANLTHADREAKRLGLELGLLASSGWNAGGTWVTPEHAGIGLYASAQEVRGPAALALQLAFPSVPEHSPRGADGRPAYWRTVAVQASPTAGPLAPEQVLDLTAGLGADGVLRADLPAG
ncbi:MAG: hypothetical protein FJ265_19520, partial [Planctomycetes bacterium]|nr:hypothetical protein [Planctomycetota bacterium]